MSSPALQVFPPVEQGYVLRPQTIEELLRSSKPNRPPSSRWPWVIPLIAGVVLIVAMMGLFLHHAAIHTALTNNKVAPMLLANYHWSGFYRVAYLIVTS